MLRLLKPWNLSFANTRFRREKSAGLGGGIALFFAISCFAFGFRWIVDSSLHWERRSTVWAVIMAVSLGAVLAFRPENRWFPTGGSLIIGDDFIEGRTQYNGFTSKKRISQQKVKSISEDKRG